MKVRIAALLAACSLALFVAGCSDLFGGSDVRPPAEVTNLTATPGVGQVKLTWNDPGDADFDHVTISYSPSGTSVPGNVSRGTGQSTVTGLTADVTYSFTVKAVDRTGNASAGAVASGKPTAAAPLLPEIDVKVGTTSIPSDSGSHDFGGHLANGTNATVTFTIANTGTAVLNLTGDPKVQLSGTDQAMFSVVQPSFATVSAAGSTTFSITFAPTTAGTKSATVTIANNDADEGSYTFALNGTATTLNAPEIRVTQGSTAYASGSTYSFGSQLVPTSSSAVTFTIANQGTDVLNLTGLTNKVMVTGANPAVFTVTAQPSTPVAILDSTTFSVVFTAGAVGDLTATLSIANDDPDENPYTIVLTGTGVRPEIDVTGGALDTPIASGTGSYAFGDLATGATGAAVTFKIANVGGASLTLTGTPVVTLSGSNPGDFTVTQPSLSSVAASGNTTFTMRFVPTAAGTRTATVSVASDDADENPYTFAVTGAAYAPDINVTATGLTGGSYTFSPTHNYETTVTTFTIGNTGNAASSLVLGGPAVSIAPASGSGFTIAQPPTATAIAGGGSTTFTVTYYAGSATASLGNHSATISVSSNDPDESPYTFTVNGSTYYGTAATYGTTGTLAGQLQAPQAVVYNEADANHYVYVADKYRSKVIAFDSDTGAYVFHEFGAAAGNGTITVPVALAVDGSGNVYVASNSSAADAGFRYVQKFDALGNWIAGFGTNGTGDGQFVQASGLAIGPDTAAGDQAIYVTDENRGLVQVFALDGTWRRKWSVAGTPKGIVVLSDESVLVAPSTGTYVQKYTNAGVPVGNWGTVFSYGSTSLAVRRGTADTVYINYTKQPTNDPRIEIRSAAGALIGVIKASAYSPAGTFANPMGMSYASNGFLYFVNWADAATTSPGPNSLVKAGPAAP